ncbi:Crp/Fnr family transcriptional regulator [Allostreptomyces psammosilenae]|uniref:CRP-like cAMP-binding protein n=1 Tax=Allostreptomyces psammosilenae TaxID=1892865 RepID=A0A853A2U2_9ACTN|nr:Crp/Fnr family transcriptional regulator [Allostreptomyces psammosilenae]NYI07790.1 CRP-like cAMP-binding protein [Allostreptomyces psammosilenae]
MADAGHRGLDEEAATCVVHMEETVYQCHRALFGDRLWGQLLRLAPARRRPCRTVLLREGDAATHVLVLAGGSVAVSRQGGPGREATLLAVRGPGELLGELAVLDEGRRTATVVAAEDCQVHTVPAADFRRFVDRHDLHRALLRQMVGRVRENDEIRAELAAGSIPYRLASALLRLSFPPGHDGPTPVRVRLTQEELARMIGACRNAVGGALRPWQRQGWVRTATGGGLLVEDPDALRRAMASL